jgi:hypothetical protein
VAGLQTDPGLTDAPLRPSSGLGDLIFSYLWHWPVLSIPRYFGVDFRTVLGTLPSGDNPAGMAQLSLHRDTRQAHAFRFRVAWRHYVAPAGLLACHLSPQS